MAAGLVSGAARRAVIVQTSAVCSPTLVTVHGAQRTIKTYRPNGMIRREKGGSSYVDTANTSLLPAPPTMSDSLRMLRAGRLTDSFRAAVSCVFDSRSPGFRSFQRTYGVSREGIIEDLNSLCCKFVGALTKRDPEALEGIIIPGSPFEETCLRIIERNQERDDAIVLRIIKSSVDVIAINPSRQRLGTKEQTVYQAVIKFTADYNLTVYDRVNGRTVIKSVKNAEKVDYFVASYSATHTSELPQWSISARLDESKIDSA